MEGRLRVSVTLHEPWMVYLRWLAAERGTLPAELARDLIETGLERSRADVDVRLRFEEWLTRGGDDPRVVADVVRALAIDGVPHVLGRSGGDASQEAQRAARYLGLVSVWLADPRPPAERPAPPRLDEMLSTAVVRRDVAPALAAAGGADGATVRRSARGGRPEASDKRQLSDTAPARAGEVRNDWT